MPPKTVEPPARFGCPRAVNVFPDSETTIAKRFVLASARLRPFVDRIWGWECESAAPLPLLMPGTGAELIFQYRAPFAVIEPRGLRVIHERALVFCLRSHACQLVATGPVGFISARLRGEALRHFTQAPLAEWIDGFTPIGEVLGEHLGSVSDKLQTLSGFTARSALVETALEHLLASRPPSRSLMDCAIPRLYYSANTARVASVAGSLNMSARHFERMFRDATGLSPKRFQRVARFHHTMRQLLIEQRTCYLPIALAQGYYDQAHFVHECRAFTSMTPGDLLNQERFLSHFYNQRSGP